MLAARFGRLNATDPRDKLYACLGVSRQLIETGNFLDHGLHPDYDKPVLQVYKEVRILSPICRTPGRAPLPREVLNLILTF
jgi:hypothetical protein